MSTPATARRAGERRSVGIGRLGGAHGPALGERLVCLPYAGGNGLAYQPWVRTLANHDIAVEAVELPGRLSRVAQPPYDDLAALVTDLADEIGAWSAGRPFHLFGHSLGALVGYELTRELVRRDGPRPRRLVVSGSVAPHVLVRHTRLAELDDVELIDHVFAMDGTPFAARLDQELVAMLVRAYRADVALFDRYEHTPGPLLDVPVSVFGGNADFGAALAGLRAWQSLVVPPVRVSVFPGGHFFPWRDDGFADILAAELRATA
ncbi:thioesterase II family protein [Micromonospora sp. URMC 107]|uniref:thioesterase II family protein n=1 Tax=Micromonospora sp. URMC 107 TaxID=3423418 RepID=UPI003F1A8B8E